MKNMKKSQTASPNNKKYLNLIQAIKQLIDFFKNLGDEQWNKQIARLGQLTTALGLNHSSFVQRLDDMQDVLTAQAANSLVQSEQLEKVVDVLTEMKEMSGKLNVPVQQKLDETINAAQDLLKDAQFSDRYNSLFSSQLMAEFERAGVLNPDETLNDFYHDFCVHAKVVDVGINNTFVIAYRDQLIQADINAKDENGNPKIHLSKSKLDYSRLFDENGIFIENSGYKLLVSESKDASDIILGSFAELNGRIFAKDTQQIIENYKARYKGDAFNEIFVNSNVPVLSADKKIETVASLDKAKGSSSFTVKSTETGHSITFTSCENEEGKKTIKISYKKDDKRSGLPIGEWTQQENNSLSANYSLEYEEAFILLQCKECRDYLADVCGISYEKQDIATTHRSDTEWKKVKTEHLDKVRHIYDVINEKMRRNISETEAPPYSVKIDNNKNTFLEIYGKGGKRLSITFDEEGTPFTMQYTPNFNDKKQKPVCVRNFATKTICNGCQELLRDKEFREMFKFAKEALEEAGIPKSYNLDTLFKLKNREFEEHKKTREEAISEIQKEKAVLSRKSVARNIGEVSAKEDTTLKFAAQEITQGVMVAFGSKKAMGGKHLSPADMDMLGEKTCANLVALGIIDKKGKVLITEKQYEDLIVDLASSNDARNRINSTTDSRAFAYLSEIYDTLQGTSLTNRIYTKSDITERPLRISEVRDEIRKNCTTSAVVLKNFDSAVRFAYAAAENNEHITIEDLHNKIGISDMGEAENIMRLLEKANIVEAGRTDDGAFADPRRIIMTTAQYDAQFGYSDTSFRHLSEFEAKSQLHNQYIAALSSVKDSIKSYLDSERIAPVIERNTLNNIDNASEYIYLSRIENRNIDSYEISERFNLSDDVCEKFMDGIQKAEKAMEFVPDSAYIKALDVAFKTKYGSDINESNLKAAGIQPKDYERTMSFLKYRGIAQGVYNPEQKTSTADKQNNGTRSDSDQHDDR